MVNDGERQMKLMQEILELERGLGVMDSAPSYYRQENWVPEKPRTSWDCAAGGRAEQELMPSASLSIHVFQI